MIKLPKRETLSLVSLHGWSGILLGFGLYVVIATGTIAVLAEEILHWSVGDVREGNPLESDLDAIVSKLVDQTDPEYREEIGLQASSRGNLQAYLHTHRENESGMIEDYGVQYEVDPETHEILSETVGTGEEVFNADQYAALEHFLVKVHVALHMPSPWGLLVTGILGLAMMVAAVSGFLMHRHLFANIFVLRRGRNLLAKKSDAHTVAGTWGLPFAFILAFTGSFFSFAGSFGIPAMAMVAFGGDQEAMIRTLIGSPATEGEKEVPTVFLNEILQDSAERVGEAPSFLSVSHYGREDSKVLSFSDAPENSLEPVQLEYNGVTGELVQEKPQLGLVPSAGSAAFTIIGPLHFGTFAGLLSKIVWVALGFASCYVTATGLSLWVERRDGSWQRYLYFVHAVSIGLPIALLAAAVAYFLSIRWAANTLFWLPATFVGASILCLLAASLLKSALKFKRALLWICGALCLLLPILRLMFGGISWLSALEQGNTAVPMMDSLLVLSALYCFWVARGQRERAAKKQINQQDMIEKPDAVATT